MSKILYIEDDREIGEWVTNELQTRGFAVDWKTDAISLPELDPYALVILDVMLPGLDGFTIGQRIKKKAPNCPVLMLSARSSVEDKVEALQFADDYVTKPFHPDELVARIEVLLRRYYAQIGDRPIQLHDWDVYIRENRIIHRETGQEAGLTGKEYQLLCYLLKHPNHILTREQIYEAVWGESYEGSDNTVMVHIHHLREKLERNPSEPQIIQTIRGLGYRLKPGEPS